MIIKLEGFVCLGVEAFSLPYVLLSAEVLSGKCNVVFNTPRQDHPRIRATIAVLSHSKTNDFRALSVHLQHRTVIEVVPETFYHHIYG